MRRRKNAEKPRVDGMVLHRAIRQSKGDTTASSVGAVGELIVDSRNNRIKGISTQALCSAQDVGVFFSKLDRANLQAKKEGVRITRTTVRAFVKETLAESIMRESNMPYGAEAIIRTGGAAPGFCLVYFGKNSDERMPALEVHAQETQNLQRVLGIKPSNLDAAMGKIAQSYSIGRLEKELGKADAQTMLALYTEAFQLYTFEINTDAISQMVGNGNIAYAARGKDGTIAAALVAEMGRVPLDTGQIVNLYELSDYATFETHQSQGLMTALQLRAIEDILSSDPRAVIYAEGRSPWTGVNRSIRRAGLVYGGKLPFHCQIKAIRDVQYDGELESLNVWYVQHGRAA